MDRMTEISIDLHGLNVAIKRWGHPDGKPVLALHGWLDNANSFDLLAPLLHQDLCIYAVDLPGHGHSSHLHQSCYYHFIDGIYHIIDLADAMGLKSFSLLGHSLGGCIASMVAGTIAERIEHLLMIDAIGPLVAPLEQSLEQTLHYLGKRQTLRAKGQRRYASIQLAAESRAQRGHISAELAAILCERGCVKVDDDYYWRHDEKLLLPSPLRLSEEQVLPFLANISAPSRLIFGSRGFGSRKERLQNRIDSVQQIETFIIDGGHHIHMEEPEKVAELINEMFDAN